MVDSDPQEVSRAVNGAATPKTLLEILASGTALIYAIGFVVVNSNYSSFGFLDYQILQSRYVGAGLTYVVTHVSGAIAVALLLLLVHKRQILFAIILCFFTWSIMAVSMHGQGRSFMEILVSAVTAVAVVVAGQMLNAKWRGVSRPWFTSFDDLLGLRGQSVVKAYYLFFFLTVFVTSVAWGRSVWLSMSPALGGGRPTEIIVVFTDGKAPSEPLLPLRTNTTTDQISMLYESAKEIVVVVEAPGGERVAMRIPKSIVSSIIYAPIAFGGNARPIPR